MTNNIKLKDLDKNTKHLLSIFLITMGIGIFTGLYFVYLTTNMTPSGTMEQYRGSVIMNDDEIPDLVENYGVKVDIDIHKEAIKRSEQFI